MLVCPRWEKVRVLSPGGLGPPLLFDKRRNLSVPCAQLLSTHTVEALGFRWREPEHINAPAICGGSVANQQVPLFIFGAARGGSGAASLLGLDSNYVAGTGGDAVCGRLVPNANLTLNNIYYNISSYTGTAANVNDINWEVRIGTATAPGTTAPDLVASGTHNPASATGWINISGLSVALTGGTIYWIIIGDADGGADFATVLFSHTVGVNDDPQTAGFSFASGSTTAGFTTNPTMLSRRANLLLVFSNGESIGSPFVASAAPSSTTNRRGLYLPDGFVASLKVLGWDSMNSSGNFSGVELFKGAAGPGDAADASGTALTYDTTGGIRGARLSAIKTLDANTAYRFVFTYSSATTQPRKAQIGTGADAALRAQMFGGGYYAEANGTTNWSNDDIDAWPMMAITLVDMVAAAGGGPLVGGRLVG